MKKVLIMGASSFVALPLIEKMIQMQYDVVAVVRPNSSNNTKLEYLKDKIQVVELEQNDYSDIWEEKNTYFDLCYYFTWSGVRGQDRDNEHLQRQNYLAFEHFVKNAKERIKKLVGIGSWAEYGNINELMEEEVEVFPISWYGKYKHKCCLYGKHISKISSMDFVWARVFSVYGPGDYNNSLIMDLCRKMLRNEEINLSACEHMWNFLYVSDVAEILFALGVNPKTQGIYNVAASESRVLKEYVYEMKEIMQSESELNFGIINTNNISMRPDVTKLRSAIGQHEEVMFCDGIKKILDKL